METIDLTDYRPKDTPDLIEIWRKEGIWGHHGSQPYLVRLQLLNMAAPADANGVVYNAFTGLDLHIKRSDKAKMHSYFFSIGYRVNERGGGYALVMGSRAWGKLDAVPEEMPDLFPYRGEGVYNELLKVYTDFWRAFVNPFLTVRHFELHRDNPDLDGF
jgi:hypothetical protein